MTYISTYANPTRLRSNVNLYLDFSKYTIHKNLHNNIIHKKETKKDMYKSEHNPNKYSLLYSKEWEKGEKEKAWTYIEPKLYCITGTEKLLFNVLIQKSRLMELIEFSWIEWFSDCYDARAPASLVRVSLCSNVVLW